MVSDIPPDAWVHGQELEQGQVFVPRADYTKESKPYQPNYFEWLYLNGSSKHIYQGGIATAGAVSFYTVPDGYTYFITSAEMTLYQVTATTYGVLVAGYPPLSQYKVLLRLASDVITDSKSVVTNPIIPIEIKEKEVVGFNLGNNQGYYGAVVHGFLIPNSLLIKEG